MDLCSKYKPLHISELEIEYPKIIEYLNSNNTFIINGPKFSGKTTIVKLYLEYLNYDYLLLDDFNLSKEYVIEKLKYRSKSVFSYFCNKKYIIVIDNFEQFDEVIRDYVIQNYDKCQFLLITHSFLSSKINYIRINNYSNDYILNLYCIIFFIEKGYNCNTVPKVENISQMFSILEFNLNLEHIDFYNSNDSNNKSQQLNENNFIFFDRFNFKFDELVREKNFRKKLYILDKINSYNTFHHNLIYNYEYIDDLANCYDNLSYSLNFLSGSTNINNNYLDFYSILSIIGTSLNLDNFKICKENIPIKKNKNLKYY